MVLLVVTPKFKVLYSSDKVTKKPIIMVSFWSNYNWERAKLLFLFTLTSIWRLWFRDLVMLSFYDHNATNVFWDSLVPQWPYPGWTSILNNCEKCCKNLYLVWKGKLYTDLKLSISLKNSKGEVKCFWTLCMNFFQFSTWSIP